MPNSWTETPMERAQRRNRFWIIIMVVCFSATAIVIGFGFAKKYDRDRDDDGYSRHQGDRDDHNPRTYPGAPEACDGQDNDGDGLLMDGERDLDRDGFLACHKGRYDKDCDDNDPRVNPDSHEICDGKDNNCDGRIPDEELDMDGDGKPYCAPDYDDRQPKVLEMPQEPGPGEEER